MLIIRKIFLARRRWDPYLLSLATAAMPIRQGIMPFGAFFFAVIGAYLVAFRPRSRKTAANGFIGLSLAYLAWVFALVLYRGEPWLHNRQLGYSLMVALLAFTASGMVLVRAPVYNLVVGARIGAIIAAAVALWGEWAGIGRFGMGGNPAPFALLVALTAIAATFPIDRAPKWLPNSYIYAITASVAVLASETRAVIIILPIIFMIEAFAYLRHRSKTTQSAVFVATIAGVYILLQFGVFSDMINRRFIQVIKYYSTEGGTWNSGTVDVRLALWKSAVASIWESPLIGFGLGKMQYISAVSSYTDHDLSSYTNLHNMFLDEAAHNGAIGLLLLVGMIVYGVIFANKYIENRAYKRLNIYMLLVVTSYGMLHNPFQHESTISGILLFIGVNVAAAQRARSLQT